MLNLLNFNAPIMVNGQEFANSDEAFQSFKDFDGPIEIKLNYKSVTKFEKPKSKEDAVFRIQVKKYMTEKSVPTFDFMKKWNDDNPMPFVVMYGTIIEETKGMYKMKLHARAESNATNCLHCGRKLTNIVSRNYGIGPICGGHMNIAEPKTIEEFKARENEIRKHIESVTWEGWIIKSAIKDMKEIKSERRATA